MTICEINLVDESKVRKVQAVMAGDETLLRLAEIFKTISDPSRVKIIYALLTAELCVCDLAVVVGISQSAVSHQLRSLRNLRLVKYRREGQMVFYSLDDEHIEVLLAQGLEHLREDQ